MTVLATAEIAQAIVDQIKNATMSWTPVLVMVGDLSYWQENPTIGRDIPAVFVQPLTLDPSIADMDGELIGQAIEFRIVLADSWAETENMVVRRMQALDELVDSAIIRNTGDDYRLGDDLSIVVERALPTRLEYAPQEHAAVSELKTAGESRNVFAAAFTLQVIARAER